jgi:hypothetical protein
MVSFAVLLFIVSSVFLEVCPGDAPVSALLDAPDLLVGILFQGE